MKQMRKYSLVALAALALAACGGEKAYIPKPMGYFDIHTPEPKYQAYDSICPFRFEYSSYSRVRPYARGDEKRPCWFDIHYPAYQATIHVSYDELENNLAQYVEDEHTLVYKHVIKSSGIEEARVLDTASGVYGMIFNIDGEPATPYQFYLTDSTRHFFRAVLYFDFKPNYDSLAPVVNFLKRDMDHMVETFEWKDGSR